MRRRTVVFIACALLVMAGCGRVETKEQTEKEELGYSSMEAEADLSYELPVSIPGILVDRLGFLPDSSKIAIFHGKEMPSSFRVIDAATGESVFSGMTEEWPSANKTEDEIYGFGDFTGLTASGTYYIEAPVLGRSYTFSISETIYDDLFRESCRQYYYNRCGITLTSQYAGEHVHNACHTGKSVLREDATLSLDATGGWHQDEKGQKDVISGAKTVAVMLMAYELFGNAFGDDLGIPESGNEIPDLMDEIKYEIDWMRKMQNQQTGAVYQGVTIYQTNSPGAGFVSGSYVESADSLSEMAYAWALAKFSYHFQNYDTVYATECLKAADRAFKHALLDETGVSRQYMFAAAAELYRASGQFVYHNYCLDYVNGQEFGAERDEAFLSGCVTYLSTKQPVKMAASEKIMKLLLNSAEDIAGAARGNPYFAAADENYDSNDFLMKLMYLTVVEHVLPNYEYEMVIENHLHYLLGRNGKAVNYTEDMSTDNPGEPERSLNILTRFDADSKLLFMLSEIVQ